MGARILIVDDHDVVRQGTRAIIQRARPEWAICAEAATGREAIQAVARLKPDVVILDISMPDMNGIEATPAIAKLAPGCRILLFTMHESDALLTEAQQLGAQGYVLKSQAGRYLIRALDRLLAGGTFFAPYAQSGSGSAEEKE
jgi:two-component system response regulator NreC